MQSAIPILSKLPIIGNLFKSKAERSEQTELMVLITPRLVRALDPDEVPPLPTRFKPIVPAGKGGVGGELEGAGMVDAPEASAPKAGKADKTGKSPKQ